MFRDAYRVLKSGGRLAVADVVSTIELPEQMRMDAGLVSGCMGNASLIEDLEKKMVEAGFERCTYHNMTGGIVALHKGFKL